MRSIGALELVLGTVVHRKEDVSGRVDRFCICWAVGSSQLVQVLGLQGMGNLLYETDVMDFLVVKLSLSVGGDLIFWICQG